MGIRDFCFKSMKGDKHQQLQRTAINWLYCIGCSVFAEEVPTWNGVADALGVRTRDQGHTAYYIEAKASRSDLLSLKQRACYKRTEEVVKSGIFKQSIFAGASFYEYQNNIDFFYFIVADGVEVEPSLYPLWGVINEYGKVIRKAKRLKKTKDSLDLITNMAHVLVYKVFGKLYI